VPAATATLRRPGLGYSPHGHPRSGASERFRRMFEFYLSSCELGFRNASMGVFQIQLAREQTAVPLTREYITAVDRGVWVSSPIA
jgi:hypothetical protein